MSRPTEQYPQDRTIWTQRHNGVGGTKRSVTLHTDESAYNYNTKRFQTGWTAKRLAEYNAGGANPRSGDRGSYHLMNDANEVVRGLNSRAKSWSTGNQGNYEAVHLCLAGTSAYFTRAMWLDRTQQLRLAAKVVAHEAGYHGIPIRKITPQQLRSGSWGITHHDDWTKAYGNSTHWDVGPGFPWDKFIPWVQEAAGGTTTPAPAPSNEGDLTMAQVDEIKALIRSEAEKTRKHTEAWIKGFIGPIGADTKDLRQQVTGARDSIPGDLAASYPGWDLDHLVNVVEEKIRNGEGLQVTEMAALAAYRALNDTPLKKENN